MIPIPEGAESYSEESTSLASGSYGDSQETLDQPGMGMLAGSGAPPNGGAVGVGSARMAGGGEGGGEGEGGEAGLKGLCELSGMPDREGQGQVGGLKLSSELEGWHP